MGTGTAAPTDRSADFVRLASAQLDSAFCLAGIILGSAVDASVAVGASLEEAWRLLPDLPGDAVFPVWFDRILVAECSRRLRAAPAASPNADMPAAESEAVPEAVAELQPEPAAEPEAEPEPAAKPNPTAEADPFRIWAADDPVARAVASLEPDARVALALRYWHGTTPEEIARCLGWRRSTVGRRLERATAAVAVLLESAQVGA
jgi:RNA polymerase sigma factor (sigma-70 family)